MKSGVASNLQFEIDRNNESGKYENKKKDLPRELRCAIKYDFRDSSIVLCFSDNYWDWSRISINGTYNSPDKNVSLSENSFNYIEKDYVYNFMNKQKFSQIYKASINNIERNAVAKRFSVKLAYMFLEDKNMQHFATEYSFDVSSNFDKFATFLRISLSDSVLPN